MITLSFGPKSAGGIFVRDGFTLNDISLSIFYIYLWELVEGIQCICFFFAYFYLFLYILYKMFGVPGAVATSVLGKDKMEPRLHSLCVTAGMSEDLMNKMGDNGFVSVSIMSNTFEDKDDLRSTFKQTPFDLSGTDLPTKFIMGKVRQASIAAGEFHGTG